MRRRCNSIGRSGQNRSMCLTRVGRMLVRIRARNEVEFCNVDICIYDGG